MVWNSILDYFIQGSLIPIDAVLVFCKIDKVINSLAVAGKRYRYYCILIVIFRRVRAKDIG